MNLLEPSPFFMAEAQELCLCSAFAGDELTNSLTTDQLATGQQVFHLVASLLDAFDRPLVVADRAGRILFTNLHAQDRLSSDGAASKLELNFFSEILHADRKGIVDQLEGGEQEVNLQVDSPTGKSR